MVLSVDQKQGRVTQSTKKLEATPGDMLRDPQLVFDKAEAMAEAYKKQTAAKANAKNNAKINVEGTDEDPNGQS
jgi:small subunit ribosomal protein S1